MHVDDENEFRINPKKNVIIVNIKNLIFVKYWFCEIVKIREKKIN